MRDHYTQLSLTELRPPRKTRLFVAVPEGHGRCSRCQQIKPRDLFYPDPARPRGVMPYCIDCYAARRSEKYYSDAHHRRSRASDNLKYKFGITIQQRDEILDSQGGKCAICQKVFRASRDIHVDHDHASGQVRGILCSRCNTSLPILEDQERHESAVQYLNKYK